MEEEPKTVFHEGRWRCRICGSGWRLARTERHTPECTRPLDENGFAADGSVEMSSFPNGVPGHGVPEEEPIVATTVRVMDEVEADFEVDARDIAITWETSQMATDMIATQAKMLNMLPLKALAEFLERGEGLGPLLDPTGYIKHGQGIRTAKRLVAAARRFVQEFDDAIADHSEQK